MSVYMSMRIDVDPQKFQEVASGNRDLLQSISDRAKGEGCIHHRWATQDGQVLVIDEWESPEAFQRFFEGEEKIAQLMQEAGVSSRPQPEFWKPVEVGDEF